MTTTQNTASERGSRGSTITAVTVLAALTGTLLANSRVRATVRTSWQRAEREHQLNRNYARGILTPAPPLPGLAAAGAGRVVWTGAL